MHRRRLALGLLALTGGLVAVLPAVGATTTLNAFDGPGFEIGVKSKTVKAGKVKLVVSDKATIHNFHLKGPGVNVKTSVSGTGTKVFAITLRKGATYRFNCDIHPSLKGSFKVT